MMTMGTVAMRGLGTTVGDLRRRQLLAMLTNDKASARDIADLVRVDPEMAQRILDSANTGLPTDRAPVNLLNEAIVLLGLRRVGELVEGLQASA